MKETHGQHMPIYFDDDIGHPEYVRGHVTLEEARDALNKWERGMGDGDLNVTHCYARWGFSQSQDYDRELNVYETPQRGAFPLTRVDLHNAKLTGAEPVGGASELSEGLGNGGSDGQ